MRLAVVVGSPYERSGQLQAIPSADVDGDLMARRLAEADAGFSVVRLPAERGLAEKIEDVLLEQTGTLDEVLVYFSGYTVLSAERGPALLLDGDRLGTFSFMRLRGLVERFAKAFCLVIDAAAVVDAGQSLDAVVTAIGQSLTGDSKTATALVSVRRSDAPDSFGGSAFTGLVLTVLDWLGTGRESHQPVDVAWLYEGLKADEQLFREIPAAGLFPGAVGFVIFPPREAPSVEGEAVPSPVAQLLPSFAGSTALADELCAAGRFDEAALEYEANLVLLDHPSERAGALARYARALAGSGRAEVALERLGEAVELDASDLDVLSVRGEWAEAAGDFQNLMLVAESWLSKVSDDAKALGMLAAAAEGLGDAPRALDARRRLALRLEDPEARVGRLLELAATAEKDLSDPALALTLVEEALKLGPSHAGALQRVTELLGQAGHWDATLGHYDRAVAYSRDEATMALVARLLGTLADAASSDATLVAQALERLVQIKPQDAPLRDRLTDLYAGTGTAEAALYHGCIAARLLPMRTESYRRLLPLFDRAGAADGAFNAASVLEYLGEADINESLLVSQHKPEGLLPVRGAIVTAGWREGLYSHDADRELLSVLEALAGSAVRVGVGFAKHKKRYVEPDPATLQDPEKSTTMLAKTLAWTARVLAIEAPQLYVLPELSDALEVAPVERPSALAGRSLGSGLGLGELSFLWGRYLPRFRPELRALSFFGTPTELCALLTAAATLGGARGVNVRSLDGDTKRLYAALRREVRGPGLDKLRDAVRQLDSHSLLMRSQAALRWIDLLGVRAGLVCCGDLSAAADLVKRFPVEGLTRAEDQLGELLAFSVSAPHTELRRSIGVAVAG